MKADSLYNDEGNDATTDAITTDRINEWLIEHGMRVFALPEGIKGSGGVKWKTIAATQDEATALAVYHDAVEKGRNIAAFWSPGSNLAWLDFDVKGMKVGGDYWTVLTDNFPELAETLVRRSPSGGRHYLIETDGLDLTKLNEDGEEVEKGGIKFAFSLGRHKYGGEIRHGGNCYTLTAPGQVIDEKTGKVGHYVFLGGDVFTPSPVGPGLFKALTQGDSAPSTAATNAIVVGPGQPRQVFTTIEEYLNYETDKMVAELIEAESKNLPRGAQGRNDILNKATHRMAEAVKHYGGESLEVLWDMARSEIITRARKATSPDFTSEEISRTVRSAYNSASGNKDLMAITGGYCAMADEVPEESQFIRLSENGLAYIPSGLIEEAILFTTKERKLVIDGKVYDYDRESIRMVARAGQLRNEKGKVVGDLTMRLSSVEAYMDSLFHGEEVQVYIPVDRPTSLRDSAGEWNSVLFPYKKGLLRLWPDRMELVDGPVEFEGKKYRHTGKEKIPGEADEDFTILDGVLEAYHQIKPGHKIGLAARDVRIREEYRQVLYPVLLNAWLLRLGLDAPIINVFGLSGSGKSRLLRKIGYVLNGFEPGSGSLDALDDKNLYGYAGSTFLALDEAGSFYGKYEGTIKRLTEGTSARKRVLYVTEKYIWVSVHMVLATGSTKPIPGSNEQIVNRTILIGMEEPGQNDLSPLHAVEEQAELLWLIQKVMPYLNKLKTKSRLAFTDIIAKALGHVDVGFDYDLWTRTIDRDREEASKTITESDVIDTILRVFEGVLDGAIPALGTNPRRLKDGRREVLMTPGDIKQGVEYLAAEARLMLSTRARQVLTSPRLISEELQDNQVALEAAGYLVAKLPKHMKRGTLFSIIETNDGGEKPGEEFTIPEG